MPSSTTFTKRAAKERGALSKHRGPKSKGSAPSRKEGPQAQRGEASAHGHQQFSLRVGLPTPQGGRKAWPPLFTVDLSGWLKVPRSDCRPNRWLL